MFNSTLGDLPLSVTDPLGIINALAASRARRRDQRRQRASAIVQLRAHLLAYGREEQLDLFTGPAADERQSLPAVAITTRSFCRNVAIKWTDAQIMALCDGIIEASLEGLKTFTNPARRRELLTWFGPSSDPTETLSFAFCCRVAGLQPEPISEEVWRNYKAEIRGYLAEDDIVSYDERQIDFAFA